MIRFTFSDPEEGERDAEITNVKIGGLWMPDYPEFVDAFIEFADVDDQEAEEFELDQMNEDADFRYDMIAEFGDH
jgi:hypothetical protein